MRAIESFLGRTGMSASTFGIKAVNDGKFVTRLRAGKRCWPETAAKARAYIAANPKRRVQAARVDAGTQAPAV